MGLRMIFNGIMALSVGSLGGRLDTASPADVARTSAKVLNVVAPIARLSRQRRNDLIKRASAFDRTSSTSGSGRHRSRQP